MDPKIVQILVLVIICWECRGMVADTSLSREEDLELERQLKTLNKPPIKTIKTMEGEIIDCVDINKQPALDHPLLKNHKVQTRPVTFPSESPKMSSKSRPPFTRRGRESCPKGTVPIRRTSKEDLIRARSMTKESMIFPSGHRFHVANLAMKKDAPYFGVQAHIQLWNLSVANDQHSSSNMWIQNGPPDQLNVIIAGWTVSPSLNGDMLTRMFIYWTADGSKTTGCYNQRCPGFVSTNAEITPDYPLLPTSIYLGDRYDINMMIYQDQSTGNWWFAFAEDNVFLGYWPKELFNHLSGGAESVAWGGIAIAGKNGISPPMGSGRLPNGWFYEGSYFRNIHIVDDQKNLQNPNEDALEVYKDQSGCYDLINNKNCKKDQLYYCFSFGGPGGQCGD